jgi:uracil-DNA glycosylase family 4
MARSRTGPDTPSLLRAARAAVRGDLAFGLESVLLPAAAAMAVPAEAGAPAGAEDDEVRGLRRESLAELAARHDRECPHCTVATGHRRTVFGEGDPMAEILFVGEAPGETEDREGRPFVGKAGQKLDDMIMAMGLARSQVYIANVLKSRPPDNRTPLRHEVEQCGPYLAEQIRIIRPKVIVALGGPAAKLLLGTEEGITRLRGVWGTYRAGDLEVPVMPTFHPAYLLRNYTPEVRREVWSDLQSVLARIRESGPGGSMPPGTGKGG